MSELASEYRPQIKTQVGRIIRRFERKCPSYEGESLTDRLGNFYQSQLPQLLERHKNLQLSSGDVIQRARIIKEIIIDNVPTGIRDEVSEKLSKIEMEYDPHRVFPPGLLHLTLPDTERILRDVYGKKDKRK